jgi:epoxide hydrolase
VFELGEDLFDQVQVRGVFRQEERALPLLLTHGWSGSVLEFSKVIGPLTDPVAHGGKASDAFHVIVPSLPGFGFSDEPQSTGWPLTRTAKAWAELMKRLGYNRYVAQGDDLGAGKPEGLAAIHLNFPTLFPPPIEGEPDAKEKAALGQLMRFRDKESGYSQIQKTRPQTLGYGLTDSPIGQAAWIYEKCIKLAGDGISYEDVLSFDEVLDDITLYWLTATATSAARLYWESWDKDWGMTKVDIPVGCSIFPGEIYRAPQVWAKRAFSNLFLLE